jgi:mycothiol synthase
MKPPASHPYRHPDDLEAVMDLILTCRAEAPTDPWPPVHDIRARLSAQPGISNDARVWVDDRERPVAFAMIWEGNIFLYHALPQAGDETLEMHALTWATERARTLAEQCGERTVLCVPVRDDDPYRAALLARAGLRLEEWHMIRMRRWLHQPIADPSIPPGFTLRAVAGESEAPALVDLHHAAFATASETVAERVAWMRSPTYDPRLDLVAVAPDGALAAFCRCSICAEENTRPGFSAAWIDLIGVHPAYCRQGLGRALLLLALRTMRAIGIAQALLSVGSWNTPAQRLFESCGFVVACRVFWHVYDAEMEMAV